MSSSQIIEDQMRGNDDQTDRRRARERPLRRPVTTFVLGRSRTWMLALWSGYIATWATVTGSRPLVVAAWWLAGVALWQAIAPMRTESSKSPEQARVGAHVAPAGGAVQDWESEGGTIA